MSRRGGGSVPNSASSSLCSLPAPSDLHSSLAAPLTATSFHTLQDPQPAGGEHQTGVEVFILARRPCKLHGNQVEIQGGGVD